MNSKEIIDIMCELKSPRINDLVNLAESLRRNFDRCNWIYIDEVLLHLPLELLAPETMVIIIRITSEHRDNLIYWDLTLDNIRSELDYRKLNSDKILRGLK